MNKEELVRQVAQKTRMPQKDIALCLNTALETITRTLGRGQRVTLVGFGSFQIRERAAREGRNPRTGSVLQIPARRAAVWIAGKHLRERLEGTRKRRQLVEA
jgi:DNA-binding protein HU-beta